MNRKQDRRSSRWLGLILAFLLAGCAAPPGTLYLQPGSGLAAGEGSEWPVVQLAPFAEDFGPDGVIGGAVGGRFFHSHHQLLKVRKQQTALALERLIGRDLAKRGLPSALGGSWNGTIAGLDRIKPPVRLVVAGRISRLWLAVKSRITHSNYTIQLDVSWQLGMVGKKKVTNLTVHVSEEMVKFTSRPEEMEKLLEKTLAEAARQVALKIGNLAKTSRSRRTG